MVRRIDRLKSFQRIAFCATGLCMLSVVFVFVTRGCGSASSARYKAPCVSNLSKLYEAIETFVRIHGDLPRDSNGQVSIDILRDEKTQREVGLDSSVLRCPADVLGSGPSYLLNPRLRASELRSGSTTIVACDKPSNHVGVIDSANFSMVLMGDGSVRLMALPLKVRERWCRSFLAGDDRAANAPDVGSWYTGE